VTVYFVMPMRGRLWPLGVLLGLGALVATVPLAVRQARAVLVSPQPVFDAGRAVALLVTGLLLSFAATYYVLGTQLDDQMGTIRTKVDALYFCVTVVSTTGFGDVVATGQLARGIVTAQIVFDLAFLALAVRLITWAAGRNPAARRGPES